MTTHRVACGVTQPAVAVAIALTVAMLTTWPLAIRNKQLSDKLDSTLAAGQILHPFRHTSQPKKFLHFRASKSLAPVNDQHLRYEIPKTARFSHLAFLLYRYCRFLRNVFDICFTASSLRLLHFKKVHSSERCIGGVLDLLPFPLFVTDCALHMGGS